MSGGKVLIGAVVVLLAVRAVVPAGDQETRFLSSLGKVDYEFRITEAALHKSPDWTDDQEHPPLSARKAQMASKPVWKALLKKANLDSRDYPTELWGVRSIDLTPVAWSGRWIWVVQYECRPRKANLESLTISVPVLMDGTAVEPTITAP